MEPFAKAYLPRMREPLELRQDFVFERRDWFFQRLMWGVMGFFVCAAVAGAFGSGPLNSGRARSPSGRVIASFDRFPHLQTETRWEMRLEGLQGTREVVLDVDGRCLEGMRLEALEPPPSFTRVSGTDMIFGFILPPGASSARARFRLSPERPGLTRCRITAGNETIAFRQWVYP